jgi:hypothetical protein
MHTWPVPVLAGLIGAIAGLSFASTSALAEPLVNQLLVRLPWLLNHAATGLIGGLLWATGLVVVLYWFSGKVAIPLFGPAPVLWLAGGVATSLALASLLRVALAQKGEGSRVLTEALLLSGAAWAVSAQLGNTDERLWEWSCWLSFSSAGAYTAAAIVQLARKPAIAPEAEAEIEAGQHRCPECDRPFATAHGLSIHYGRMHKGDSLEA